MYTRKLRITGETLTVARPEEIGADTSEGKWVTFCEDHKTLVYSATEKLAYYTHGRDFCDDCRAEVEGTVTPDDDMAARLERQAELSKARFKKLLAICVEAQSPTLRVISLKHGTNLMFRGQHAPKRAAVLANTLNDLGFSDWSIQTGRGMLVITSNSFDRQG